MSCKKVKFSPIDESRLYIKFNKLNGSCKLCEYWNYEEFMLTSHQHITCYFINNKKNGLYVVYHKNKEYITCYFINNKKNSEAIDNYFDGSIMSSRYYLNGKKNGKVSEYFNHHNILISNELYFINDIQNGQSIDYDEISCKQINYYIEGKNTYGNGSYEEYIKMITGN